MKEEINSSEERREDESVYYYTLMWIEKKMLTNFPPQKFLDVLLKSDLVCAVSGIEWETVPKMYRSEEETLA